MCSYTHLLFGPRAASRPTAGLPPMPPRRTQHKDRAELATECGNLLQPAACLGTAYGIEPESRRLTFSHCWRATSTVAFNLAKVARSS